MQTRTIDGDLNAARLALAEGRGQVKKDKKHIGADPLSKTYSHIRHALQALEAAFEDAATNKEQRVDLRYASTALYEAEDKILSALNKA